MSDAVVTSLETLLEQQKETNDHLKELNLNISVLTDLHDVHLKEINDVHLKEINLNISALKDLIDEHTWEDSSGVKAFKVFSLHPDD